MHFVALGQMYGFESRVTTDIYPSDFAWAPNWQQADERMDKWYHNMQTVKEGRQTMASFQIETVKEGRQTMASFQIGYDEVVQRWDSAGLRDKVIGTQKN